MQTYIQTCHRLAVAMLLVAGISGCTSSEPEPNVEEEHATPASTSVGTSHSHPSPDETCFMCDATKRDAGRLWCKEHIRYEDRCFLCHPEIEQKDRLYCNEHFLYEDECFLCHPELLETPATPEPSARDALFGTSVAELSDTPEALYCNEHDVYERECGICHPELLVSLSVGSGLKVRLQSAESAQKAGVRVGRPQDTTISDRTAALGEVTYNKNAFAAISPLAAGVIREVHADVGEFVRQGTLLAEVNAPDLADAKSTLAKALVDAEFKRQTYDREKVLWERNVASAQTLEAARADHDAAQNETARAKQQLLNLGLSDGEVADIVRTRSTSSTLPLRAPFDGTIVRRDAVNGTAVEPGQALFHLASIETMWLELSAPERDAGRLAVGATIEAHFDALPGRTFNGELTWISTEVNPETRTVQARATLDNTNKRLRSGLFGQVEILGALPDSGTTVPVSAIQEVDGRTVVFAKLENDLYETRIVKTGARRGGLQTVLSGISPADEIVVAESFILKSELLKARLGAGCVH